MPTLSPRLALARDLTRCAALEVDGARVAMERLARQVYLMSDATYEDTFLAVIAEREAIFRARGGPRERYYPGRNPPVDPHTFLPMREPHSESDDPADPEIIAPPRQPSPRVRALSIAALVVVLLGVAFVLSVLT